MNKGRRQSKIKTTSKYKTYFNNFQFKYTEEEDIISDIDENNEDDYSQREISKNERNLVNPETERISKRKIGFQIIKVKERDKYSYELINLTNNIKLYNNLKNIINFFPWFETLTKEKFYALASDNRSGGILTLDKNYRFNYSIQLPNGDIVPLSTMVKEKGKYENPFFSKYRKFRKFINENINYINQLKKGDVKKEAIKEEDDLNIFIGEFLVAIERKKGNYNQSYINESYYTIVEDEDRLIDNHLVEKIFKEYKKFFWE
ncbi:hypothetical protein [Marinitoga sp. 38H-ov]|uniref:hypothetical protein n=1 Tax=Marinitoga sp. 38H-ov TaxID=1755814 RepID=UPI0013EBF029|nr:hypothetical protein [Marinitoga sp. 38H-ov]KAF2956652.1 hypothetical protein AS160_04460 [Marinitoga sp. 38H-ov]